MASAIILVGFMGSGKTTIGGLLAQRLGFPFYDADRLIEVLAQASISSIFAERGEVYFRELEERSVLKLLDRLAAGSQSAVVALGGGAVTVEAIYRRLKSEPRVVFLEQSLEIAFQRAQDGLRPLARDRQAFNRLYDQRQALYLDVAKNVVDVQGKSPDEIVAEIIDLLALKADIVD